MKALCSWLSLWLCFLLIACSGPQKSLRGSPRGDGTTVADKQAFGDSGNAPGNPRTSRAFDLVYTSGGGRNCEQEQIDCFRRCWNTQPPYPIKRGDKGHHKYCTSKCREEYMECVQENEAHPLVFPDMETAKDWVRRHHTEVVVGSIVVVAGATFVVATLGAGALVLVPLAAL